MEIKERLLEIIKKNNLNASSFADRLNVQRSSISHILSGRNKPSIDFIQKFAIEFPNEDIRWLITGQNNLNNQTTKNIHKNNYNNLNKESISLNDSKQKLNHKKITRIITIYEDQTFDILEISSL